MLGLSFSSRLDLGYYIISIAKTASKKIGGLIRSINFLSHEFALYLYKSNIHSCMKYQCYVWLMLLVATWNCQISYKNGYAALLVLHLLPLLNPLLIQLNSFLQVSLFVDVHPNWFNWFHFLILVKGLLIILMDCMIFLSPSLDAGRISMSTVSFLDSGILCLENAFL